jgi:hypothetical protein
MGENDTAIRALSVLVEEVAAEAVAISKLVVRFFPEFTLHDEVHIAKVIDIMRRLMPQPTFDRLQPLEIATLLLAASLHDVGMAPTEEEADTLLGMADNNEYRQDYDEYAVHRRDHPRILEKVDRLRSQGLHPQAEQLEKSMLTDYLRISHAERGMRFIRIQFRDRLVYDNYNFTEDLARVCFSHNEDTVGLEELSCWQLVRGPDEYCNWGFVALLLRLADVLDCDAYRTPRVLFRHLGVRSPASLAEWQKHLSICAVGIRPGNISVTAQCPDPYTHKDVLKHIGLVEKELGAATEFLRRMHHPHHSSLAEHYRLDLPTKVDIENIQPGLDENGQSLYEYQDLRFQLDDERIMDLVMGVNLYADKYLFLRELVQNAVDTCRLRCALHRAKPDLGKYTPRIAVRIRRGDLGEMVEVEDNGMGMDREIVRDYFAKVGSSYYRSRQFRRMVDKDELDFRPVSQFGIGVLSVFMVGDRVDIETSSLGRRRASLALGIDGPSRLFWTRNGQRSAEGTIVRVNLTSASTEFLVKRQVQESNSWDTKQIPSLAETVKKVAPHLEFPITVVEDGAQYEIQGTWKLPNDRPSYSRLIETITLDLTEQGPHGLDGRVRIFLLRESSASKGRLYTSEIELENDSEADSIRLSFGKIEEELAVYNRFGEEASAGSTRVVSSKGHWSQHGFYVQYPLFKDYFDWSWRQSYDRPMIEFPLPVHYDLNLHSEFVMPLSADRKSILPHDKAYEICRMIGTACAKILLAEIGTDAVQENRDFFLDIVEHSGQKGEGFLNELSRYFDVDTQLQLRAAARIRKPEE